MISELGRTAIDFLEEVASQMDDEDPVIYYYSAEMVACYGANKYMDDFMRVFAFLSILTLKLDYYLCFSFQSYLIHAYRRHMHIRPTTKFLVTHMKKVYYL